MRKRIKLFGSRMLAAVRSHPVEVSLSLLACAMGCYGYESDSHRFDTALRYMPVVFLLAYTLNGCGGGRRGRALYYLSAFLWIPLLAMPAGELFSSTHLVSLVVTSLVYLGSGWERDNRRFVENALFFARSLFYAGALSVLVYLLAGSIYKSIRYIFEIWQGGTERVITYMAIIVFSIVSPLLFLMFNERRERAWLPSKGRLFDVLLNYVLSPALLVYAAILYLYFIKIAILWSLPKGAVASIVVSFTSAVFVLKGCQVFLSRRYYDWFYERASLAVLPALAMFWVGTLYRIREYGFTEPRVYLVVVGLILSGTAVLFFARRWASYLYAACWSVFLLAAVTYIPGMTAHDIERVSQSARGNYPMREAECVEYVHISSDKPIDIRGYSTMESLRNYEAKDAARLRMEEETILVYDKEDALVYRKSYDAFLDEQLRKAGLSSADAIPETAYPDLLRIDLDSSVIILEMITLRRDSTYHVQHVAGDCFLKE